MHLRPATINDVPQIETLLRRSYAHYMSDAYAPDVLEVALPTMTQTNAELIASRFFYIAEHQDQIIGCGGWSNGAPGSKVVTENLAHIRHFAVDPCFERRGIGRLLFQTCSDAAVRAGATRLQALSSLNAEPFYSGMGLMRTREISIKMGPILAFPVIEMEGEIRSM